MIIYKATNKLNNKIYIGQTVKDLSIRIRQHLYDSTKHKTNMLFHKALRKYGQEAFTWEIVMECNDYEELSKLEIYYIDYYNSLSPNGYNMGYNTKCMSGELNPNYGNKMSDESKNKISIAAKDRLKNKEDHPWFGRRHSEETKAKMCLSAKDRSEVSEITRKKMSESGLGRKHSEDTKLKLSENHSGENNPFYGKKHSEILKEEFSKRFSGLNNPFYNKRHSEETKAKMRESWELRKSKKIKEMKDG